MPDPGDIKESNPPLPAADYRFRRQGRSLALALALAAWLLALAALAIFAQASLWLIALLGLPTLPGLYELGKNPQSGLDLTEDRLSWFTGSLQGAVPVSQIARLRLDTRLDLSVRATLVLTSGDKLRLPQPATPPVEALTQALDARGIPHERHHFSLF
jgi:hypothetical protein